MISSPYDDWKKWFELSISWGSSSPFLNQFWRVFSINSQTEGKFHIFNQYLEVKQKNIGGSHYSTTDKDTTLTHHHDGS